jgi:predicted amidohydrolase YtcJ
VKTLYRADLVRTLTHPETGVWLLTDGRHVQRVGSGEPPRADRVVDLPGGTIVPGFIDAHVHLTGTGAALDNAAVEATTSAAELLALAGERCRTTEGPVVLSGFDESRWDRPEHPGVTELDAISGDALLVIVRADGHAALANSAAIALTGIEGEEGVERDDDGDPTGRVTEQAVDRLARWAAAALTDHQVQALQLKGAGLAAARGVTSIHEMQMPHTAGLRDLQVLLGHRARLPVDPVPIVATMDLPLVIDHGFASVGGDLPVDGSIGARTAAVMQPYVGTSAGDGVTYYEDDALAEFFHAGHTAGLQVGVHAIGDRAIEQVLRGWERVYRMLDSRERRHFRARRHRIEHCEMVSPEQVERVAVLGLGVSVQPAFDRAWGDPGGLYDAALGWDRAASMNPYRTMLERGIEVGAGSDAPVTPLDPLGAVAAMQAHHEPAQRLSRLEAIRLHTIGSARLAHQEDKKGALGAGMHADFVVYPQDPFETESLEGLAPILTVSLGRDVYAA